MYQLRKIEIHLRMVPRTSNLLDSPPPQRVVTIIRRGEERFSLRASLQVAPKGTGRTG